MRAGSLLNQVCLFVLPSLEIHEDCEAHGGYAFCGLAGLALLNRLDLVVAERLLVRLLFDFCYSSSSALGRSSSNAI